MTAVPLLPRKLLFSNPDHANLQLSPDGQRLAYLAPLNGVLNIWLAPRGNPQAAQPLTRDTSRGVHWYWWAYTNRDLLYIQDQNGDENGQLFRLDIATRQVQPLTPFAGVQTRLLKTSPLFPDEAVIGLNQRRPEWHDLYRLNLHSGDLTLLEQNDRFANFVIDDHLQPVLAFRGADDGGLEIFRPAGQGSWELWETVPSEDVLTTYPIDLDQAGGVVFMKDSRGRNTAAVIGIDLSNKAAQLLAEDPRADAWDVVFHPTQKHVQAVSFVTERKRWQVLDPAIEPDLNFLAGVADGELEIISRSLDDQFWIVRFLVDDSPIRFYLFDRAQRQARYLFSDLAALEGQPLVKMHSATISSRDGLDLVLYYSLPPGADPAGDGRPDRPMPMVFIPHGGPWGP